MSINISENKIKELTVNAEGSRVKFMLYGDEFVSCYSELMNTKIIIKHLIWWLSSIINFILIRYIFL